MIQLSDLVCANVEENGKKVAKSAPFKKTYFSFGPEDATTERDKQFNGTVIGKVTVPKDDTSKHSVEALYKDMLDFFHAKYPSKDPRLTVMDLVTAAYDISERAPASQALKPAKALDEDKVFKTTAENFSRMGGIMDPSSGTMVTDVPSIIAVLKVMAGK